MSMTAATILSEPSWEGTILSNVITPAITAVIKRVWVFALNRLLN